MITATFTTNKEAGSIALRLVGHAGAAEKGKDIVCAAASILAYTLAQTLQFLYEEGGLHKRPKLKLDEGDTLIIAKPKRERYEEALHAFFVAQVGFHLLSHSYPQYVALESFGSGDA